MTQTKFVKKVRITASLVFDTAFHIGSGNPGDLAADMGVLKDFYGQPILPGSSLKGCFRSAAERLSGYLNMQACLLDKSLSGVDCVSDKKYFENQRNYFKELKTESEKLEWLKKNTCDVCKLFGSPMQASRIFFSDGELIEWKGKFEIRDGVVIDRDSGTARQGLKYNFEATAADTAYRITIDLENPTDNDLALTGAALSEWEIGFRIGGFTSRGIGAAKLSDTKVYQVDFCDKTQLKNYLINRQMLPADSLLKDVLESVLNQ